jgi:maleylacetoacetate isomerase
MVAQTGEVNSASELLRRYAGGDRSFEQVRLVGADFHSAILHGIDLSSAILSGANFNRTDLRGADLSWADLSGADLSGAELQGAILTRADLSGANLSRANLRKADLSLATLTDANFQDTIMPDGTLHNASESATPESNPPDRPESKLVFYHQPVSPNSRRVWIALLEKQLPFEAIELNLDGDQLQPDFLALNPFHRVPVLVDGGLVVVESLAILDYLEAKYPLPALMPSDPQSVARVRMVELLSANELWPAMNPLVAQMMGFGTADESKIERSQQQVKVVLDFFAAQLGDRTFFGGDRISLADIVAGTGIIWLPQMGVPLSDYPNLNRWVQALTTRESWQQTHPTPTQLEALKEQMQVLMAQRESMQ